MTKSGVSMMRFATYRVLSALIATSVLAGSSVAQMSQANQVGYDSPPVLVHRENVPPNHQEILLSSEEARKVAEPNVIVLQFVVALNGLPAKVRLIRGIGPQLDEKSVETVRGDRFKPALKDGKPVLATIYLKFLFEPAQN